MEQEQMLLDTLVEELQESYFDIPFGAWHFICQKLRKDLEKRFPSHKKFEVLTDVEARLMYSRYMFHVSQNYRQLCKSIITGYPDFNFPKEVKQMLIMTKYKDIEGEQQSDLFSSSSSPPPSPSPACRRQMTINKLVNYEDDDCESTRGNLDNSDSGQHNESMISATNQQQQPVVVVDDEQQKQQQDIRNVHTFIPPSPPSSSRDINKEEDSRLLFINPEPPLSKSLKRENNDHHHNETSLTPPPSDSNETSVPLQLELISIENPSSSQPAEQFDPVTNDNSLTQVANNAATKGHQEDEGTAIEASRSIEKHPEPAIRANLKREYGAHQQAVAMKRLRLENKSQWTAPRPLCLPKRVKYVHQESTRSTETVESCTLTADKFTLISCEAEGGRKDPRNLGGNLSCGDGELIVLDDDDDDEGLAGEVTIFGENEQRRSHLPNNNNNNNHSNDNASQGEEESETTTNNLIENELSRYKESTTTGQLRRAEEEEEEDVFSVEEEEESEGEEVAPETFGECFERRRRNDQDDAASTISSISDSSFYSASHNNNNAQSNDNKNPVISPSPQQKSDQSSLGGRSLSLSSDTDKVFKITIDNEYCNKTHAGTPPLVSPSSTVSLDTVIIAPENNNIYHDIDERILNPVIPKVSMNPIVDSLIVSNNSQNSMLSPCPLPPALNNNKEDNGKSPNVVVIPPTAPFHWHAVNYPSALSSGVPSPQVSVQTCNPWAEAFEACQQSLSPTIIVNRQKKSTAAASSHRHVLLGPPKTVFNFPAPSNNNNPHM